MSTAGGRTAEAAAALERGHGMEAVAVVREPGGPGFVDARKAVERHRRGQPPGPGAPRGARDPGAVAPAQRRLRGAAVRLMLLLALSIAAAALVSYL